jgi:hypothetical protein
MYLHANAKLGLAGRLALVRAIEAGMTLKAAAAAFSVSPATWTPPTPDPCAVPRTATVRRSVERASCRERRRVEHWSGVLCVGDRSAFLRAARHRAPGRKQPPR